MTVAAVPNGSLSWEPFDIPGGSAPVRLATLRVERPSRARTMLVEFPRGWTRDGAGSYETSEELLVLRGSIALSGETYREGDWALFPEGFYREAMSADALCFVRWGGPARWRFDAGDPSVQPVRGSIDVSRTEASPLGQGGAGVLWRGETTSSFIADAPVSGMPAPRNVELLDLRTHAWHYAEAGEPLPSLAEGCFVRTHGE
ncbi:MAG TPA: hypothetical protein VGB83_12300 [Actinomycetota bacterium]